MERDRTQMGRLGGGSHRRVEGDRRPTTKSALDRAYPSRWDMQKGTGHSASASSRYMQWEAPAQWDKVSHSCYNVMDEHDTSPSTAGQASNFEMFQKTGGDHWLRVMGRNVRKPNMPKYAANIGSG